MLRKLLVAATLAGLATGAAAQNSVRIAVLGPMALPHGESHWFGAEMARDEINKAGGINVGGKRIPVELIRVDTNEHASVPDATNAIERAITRDRADILVGGFRSEAVLAMQEVAMDNRRLFIGVGASHDQLGLRVEQNFDRYKYWFRVAPTKSTDLARTVFTVLNAVAGQMRKELKTEQPRVAILAERAIWVDGLIKAAQAQLPAMKMEVVGLWQPSANATDVTAELAAIDRANADIVFTLLSGPVGVVVGRQMGERNMRAVAFGINVEAQKDEFWKAAAGRANFVSTIDTYADVELTPRTIPFMRAFRERYMKSPIYTAATYDAILIVRDAIERAGTLNPDKVVPEMQKTSYTGVTGVIEFDKRHDPVWGLGKSTGIAVQWFNGEQVPFWPPNVKGMGQFRMPPR